MADRNELEAIYRRKIKFIERQQAQLLRGASVLETRLLKLVLDELFREMITNKGFISDKNNSVKLTVAIDRIFDAFVDGQQTKIMNQLAKDFDQILTYNAGWYSIIETDKRLFRGVKSRVRAVMLKKIGITDDGRIRPNSYLDTLTQNRPLREVIKQMTFNAVNRQQKLSDFTDSLELVIKGSKKVDGSLVKYYKGFAYDTYQQFDRANNMEMAKELDLTFFIYSGGLIETSRDFCIAREGKIFTTEEAERDWPTDPDLPRTTAERDSGVLVGYNPIIDLGRWNCRHAVRYISKELAMQLDPKVGKNIPLEQKKEFTSVANL